MASLPQPLGISELDVLRRRLDTIVEARLLRPLNEQEELRYRQLLAEERVLLDLTSIAKVNRRPL